MSKRKWTSQSIKNRRERVSESMEKTEENCDIFLFPNQLRPNSQTSKLSQCSIRKLQSNSSQHLYSSEDMQMQEEMQLAGKVIRYLLVVDQNKHPIQKTQIVKNILNGNVKEYRLIMEKVKIQLSKVFGYKLLEIESNKYILVNEIENHFPHLIFTKHANTQVLLFLVLVHIFMLGDSCKEEILWDFLRNLEIITHNNYQHEYFGDVKQLISVDFVNQRYLEKSIIDLNDPTKFEYKWGCRAINEITYRSALTFVSDIYGRTLNNWNLQYKAVILQEQNQQV